MYWRAPVEYCASVSDGQWKMNPERKPLSDQLVVRAIQWLIYIAVAGSLVAGAATVLIGFGSILNAIWNLRDAESIDVEVVRTFSVDVIEVADAFLLGVVMFIIAVGLYQLFVNDKLDIPEWLHVSSLSDLKEDLLAVTIVLLGISFLGRVGRRQKHHLLRGRHRRGACSPCRHVRYSVSSQRK